MKKLLLGLAVLGVSFASLVNAAESSGLPKDNKKTVSFTDQVFKVYEVKGKFQVSFQRNPAIYQVHDKSLQKTLKESQSKKIKLLIEADPFALTIEKAKTLK